MGAGLCGNGQDGLAGDPRGGEVRCSCQEGRVVEGTFITERESVERGGTGDV